MILNSKRKSWREYRLRFILRNVCILRRCITQYFNASVDKVLQENKEVFHRGSRKNGLEALYQAVL